MCRNCFGVASKPEKTDKKEGTRSREPQTSSAPRAASPEEPDEHSLSSPSSLFLLEHRWENPFVLRGHCIYFQALRPWLTG